LSTEEEKHGIDRVQAAIKDLIEERFDIVNAKKNGDNEVVPSVEAAEPAPKTNGVHQPHTQSPSSSPAKRGASTHSASDAIDKSPPKKKRKASLDADAAFAARLQAEEDKLARPTRGGANRKSAPVKRKKKAKKERVTGSDDSELDDDERKAEKPKRDTGFHVCIPRSKTLS
jgi:upstream activation factor subunit UAF30